ncbi:MAG: FkbM family methyltransferase [Bacteroidota bacterium]
MNKLKWIKFVCSLFPPVVAQQVRERLITIPKAEKMALDFKRKAFTGSYFEGNSSDFHAFKFWMHGYFDWRNIVLAKHILKFKSGAIIEVGANIGTETISLADINKNNPVYAFEPLPANVASLRRLKELNRLENLTVYDVLVSDKKGEAHFKIPPANSSGSGHIAQESQGITQKFEVVTLDEKLGEGRSYAAIIADVEGYEPQVLAGAEKLISSSKPFLILEVNARFLKERAQTTVPAFHESMTRHGYRCYYIGRFGLSKVDPTNFKTKRNKNWICVPEAYQGKVSRLSRSIWLNAFNPWMRFKIL